MCIFELNISFTQCAPNFIQLNRVSFVSHILTFQIVQNNTDASNGTLSHRIGSIIFYAVASFFIVIINKMILTGFNFPSFQFVGLCQMLATVVILYFGKKLGLIDYPHYNSSIPRKIFPLPLIYMGDIFFGLAGTKALNMSMFSVLRRFSFFITMIIEYYILGVKARISVQITVYMMISGAIIAAFGDLAFNLEGYVYILLYDLFSATYVVYIKYKLDSGELNKYGILYYNALFMTAPMFLYTYLKEDIHAVLNFPNWGHPIFALYFALSCVMGFVLMFSVILCTHYNSALTTTIVGAMKNILVTYSGPILEGNYIFSWANFVGLNLSVVGGLVYTWITLKESNSKPKYTKLEKTSDEAEVVCET